MGNWRTRPQPGDVEVRRPRALNLGDYSVVVVVLGLQHEALGQPAVVAVGATDLGAIHIPIGQNEKKWWRKGITTDSIAIS